MRRLPAVVLGRRAIEVRILSSATPHERLLSSKVIESASSSVSQEDVTPTKSVWQRILAVWEESSGQIELDRLKQVVVDCSSRFDQSVMDVQNGRRAVEEAQKVHDEVHKKHANLLMRREQWNKEEAASFVDVTSEEVTARQVLQQARDQLRYAEEYSGQCQREYMDAIRRRYHEEQIWQDKWRVLGTYGTWSLIGLNSIVFLGSQIFHQRREVLRLKAIEALIHDKMSAPSPAAVVSVASSPQDDITVNQQEEVLPVETQVIESENEASVVEKEILVGVKVEDEDLHAVETQEEKEIESGILDDSESIPTVAEVSKWWNKTKKESCSFAAER
uniref:Sensitive to high expression protein 9, mitochondrial n=1 Tax=Cyclophora tenuis TaxID=216820 RepID=A0A7S1GQ64_CYCTE|mmetsp:Transcript_8110/g.13906  ORF Transcript_8110/g.13906 Transcript_8110/m.13906 type:complete len:333 (+) Transcript_8110:2-1000(+)